jgi:hypothetical protein
MPPAPTMAAMRGPMEIPTRKKMSSSSAKKLASARERDDELP